MILLKRFSEWQWPETHGEKYFVVLGGLHIEIPAWRAQGALCRGTVKENDNKPEFHQWQEYKSSSCPHFRSWSLVLKIQLTILLFVR